MNPKIFDLIGDLLKQNSGQFNSDNLMGVMSVITLLKIIDLHESQSLSTSEQNLTETQTLSNSTENNVLGQLLNQVSGNPNNNLQQMLPLLLQALNRNPSSSSPEPQEKKEDFETEKETKSTDRTDNERKNEKKKRYE